MNPTIASKAIIGKALTFSLALCLTGATSLLTSTAHAADFSVSLNNTAQDDGSLYTADQLDGLLAPIALYPDPLLAQVLVATTFGDQIQDASQLLSGSDAVAIDDQQWDDSVKAVAHYPRVLFALASQSDWTDSLGQAYVAQSTEVMASVQRLRGMAFAQGNLVSTAQQQVSVVGGVIQILPARAGYVFLPAYDADAVFSTPAFISFGPALAINASWEGEIDWHQHHIFDAHHHIARTGDRGRLGRMRRTRGPIRNRFNPGRDRGRVTRSRFNPKPQPTKPTRPTKPQATKPTRPTKPQATKPTRPTKPQATKPTKPQATKPAKPAKPTTPGQTKANKPGQTKAGSNNTASTRGQANRGQSNRSFTSGAANRAQSNRGFNQANRGSYNTAMNHGGGAARSGRSHR